MVPALVDLMGMRPRTIRLAHVVLDALGAAMVGSTPADARSSGVDARNRSSAGSHQVLGEIPPIVPLPLHQEMAAPDAARAQDWRADAAGETQPLAAMALLFPVVRTPRPCVAQARGHRRSGHADDISLLKQLDR